MSATVSPSSSQEHGAPAPRANPDLLGHGDAEQTLLQAYASGRLFHAWLITGPRGIGKATLAFRFARYVLRASQDMAGAALLGLDLPPEPAVEGSGLFVPPADPVFKRVASGGHADLVTLERVIDEKSGRRRTEIIIDQVRSLSQRSAHTAGEGGWRAAVIDAADELNASAANGLLKLLEEPPPRTLMLLVCHSLGRALPTIRSRCRILTLQPLDEPTVGALLARYLPNLPAGERDAIVRLADGGIGTALALAEQGSLSLYQELIAILRELPTPDGIALHRLGDKVSATNAGEVFATLAALLRRVMTGVLRAAATGEVAGDDDEAAVCRHLARLAPLDRWLEVWEKGAAQLGLVDRIHLDRKQILLNVVFTLSTVTRK